MPVRDVMMVAGWSFRPPRKTQILFFLFLLALEHFFLFVNSFRFCNLWLWWSRAEGAAVCCCGLASKVTEVWRLWRTHRLIVVRFFLFSIFPCLFAVLFSIFYVKDGKWSFSIVMERHCGSRLLLSFLPKINWTAWAGGGTFFFIITFVWDDESDRPSPVSIRDNVLHCRHVFPNFCYLLITK